MKLLRLVLAAALLVSGCISTPYRPQLDKPKIAVVDQPTYQKLTGAVARFTARKKVPYKGEDGSDKYFILNIWSGSAFCIKIEDGISYWITCKHVAEMQESEGMYGEIDYRDRLGELDWAKAYDIKLSPKYDIATFMSFGLPAASLELATTQEIADLDYQDFLFISGCPAGAFPPGLSVGTLKGFSRPADIRFNTFGTYGTSGSPLIDARSLKVIGVVYRFAGSSSRWGYRADDLYAISAGAIRSEFKLE